MICRISAVILLALTLTNSASANQAPNETLKHEAEELRNRVPRNLYLEKDLSCLAIAIYHEARGESLFGQLAVGSVILERVKNPERWGNTICDVVRPVQFSFLTSRWNFPRIIDRQAWERSIDVAMAILKIGPLPELEGADHYHATSVSPDWAPKMSRVGRIGEHIFYKAKE
ncbi:cell wall hydrolase [Tranquillimonas alkanivorans]|uniref:Cell Wall Hydrolase n=1 Tax=Tranquillimonas alkanivorans TaxID=441119 RepID=A0A1I5TSP4_9RHOB|nr:cell wall hydrolase [Tranquillimonas alkanivorans]SFP86043.1 Cell Wall Hydrolase [Tranquillimonas alkanivorans]